LAAVTAHENLNCIADSLAMQGWAVVDRFIDRELTAALRSDCRSSSGPEEFRPAAVGSGDRRQIRSDIRGDQIRWLQQPASSEPQRTLLSHFEHLRLTLNRTLQLGLFEFESHFARFPAGTFYARHVDQLRGDSHRKLSCVLYLNERWKPEDAGELRLYLDGDGTDFNDVLPEEGRLVVFLSERFAHEVLPAKRERLSIAGWFKTR
jgi:SM-20-related protein